MSPAAGSYSDHMNRAGALISTRAAIGWREAATIFPCWACGIRQDIKKLSQKCVLPALGGLSSNGCVVQYCWMTRRFNF